MKVNDLKALFEKAGTIKTQVNPIHNKPAPSIPHFDSSSLQQPVQPVQILPAETVFEVVKEQPRKSMVKNNDFLNQLNKKLMTKSVKPKNVEIEEPKQAEMKKQVLITKEVEFVNVNQQKIEPLPSAQESQLSFDDIMCDLGQQKVHKSTLKARYGINERHPTTREEELIFTELEEQRKSDIQNSQTTQKENSGTQAVSYLRRPKPKPQTFHSSVAYSKFKTDERIKRIDRIISLVFGIKQSEAVINQQRLYNMKKEHQEKGEQRHSNEQRQTTIAVNALKGDDR